MSEEGDRRSLVGSTSDHFDGKRFFNPGGANGQSLRNVPRLLAAPRERWPVNVPVVQRKPAKRDDQDAAVVTFIGHSTFLIQLDGLNIIVDPVYAQRAGPFGFAGPRRVRAPGVAFQDLPPIGVVLLSHNHYDHCDLAALAAIQRRDAPLYVTPVGNARILRKAGAKRIEELDWWQSTASAPVSVTATPAQHFSARTPFDRNRALWSGFTIRAGRRSLFFAGDTGYSPHFRAIRERLGVMDFAIIPIGAYEPRWFMKDIHMNPAEAVIAHREVGSTQSVACHFGTFQLTPEGIDEPLRALAHELQIANVPAEEFRVLECGESIRVRA